MASSRPSADRAGHWSEPRASALALSASRTGLAEVERGRGSVGCALLLMHSTDLLLRTGADPTLAQRNLSLPWLYERRAQDCINKQDFDPLSLSNLRLCDVGWLKRMKPAR